MLQRVRAFAPFLVLTLAVFAAYGNVYGNQFFYDDEFLILRNRYLRDWGSLGDIFAHSSTGGAGQVDAFYRPLQGFLYLIVFQLFGASTAAFHALNIILHAINANLVFALGRRLKFGASFWVALLWAVHPLHTEAVTYVSATADPLHTLFLLLGLLALRAESRARDALAAGACFILGLLSKEAAIVFPALAVVWLWAQTGPDARWKWRRYSVTLPFWLIALIYLGLRKTVLDFSHTFQFYTAANIYTEHALYRVFTFLATLPEYLRLMAWPDLLMMDRNFPVFTDWYWPVGLGAVLVSAFVGHLIWRRGRLAPPGGFAGLWFFAAHVPQSGVLIPVNALFLEHWMYLPSIGLGLGLGEALRGTVGPRMRQVLTGGVLLAALALGVRTWQQNQVWRDPIVFYAHILEHSPKNGRVHNNLAMALSDAGRFAEAETHYRAAIALGDVYPQPHYNLGLLLLSGGHRDEAAAEFKRALELDPTFTRAADKLKELGR